MNNNFDIRNAIDRQQFERYYRNWELNIFGYHSINAGEFRDRFNLFTPFINDVVRVFTQKNTNKLNLYQRNNRLLINDLNNFFTKSIRDLGVRVFKDDYEDYVVDPNSFKLYLSDPNERQFAEILKIEDDVSKMTEQEVFNELLLSEIDVPESVFYASDEIQKEYLRLLRYFEHRPNVFGGIINKYLGQRSINMLFGDIIVEDDLFDNFTLSRSELLQVYLNRYGYTWDDDQFDIDNRVARRNLQEDSINLNFGVQNYGFWLHENRDSLTEIPVVRNDNKTFYQYIQRFDPYTVLYVFRRAYLLLKEFHPTIFDRSFKWNKFIRVDPNRNRLSELKRFRVFSIAYHLLTHVETFLKSDRNVVYDIIQRIDYHSYKVTNAVGNKFTHSYQHIFPYIVGTIDNDIADVSVEEGRSVINKLLKVYYQKIHNAAIGEFQTCKLELLFRGYFEADENLPVRYFTLKFDLTLYDLTTLSRNPERLWSSYVKDKIDSMNEERLNNETKYNSPLILKNFQLIKIVFFVNTLSQNGLNGQLDFSNFRANTNPVAFCRGVPGILQDIMITHHSTTGICLYEAYYHMKFSEDIINLSQEELNDKIYNSYHSEDPEVWEMVFKADTFGMVKWMKDKHNLDVNVLMWERKDYSFPNLTDLDEPMPQYEFDFDKRYTLVLSESHCYGSFTSEVVNLLRKVGFRNRIDDPLGEAAFLKRDEKYWRGYSSKLRNKLLKKKNVNFKTMNKKNEDWAFDIETFADPLDESIQTSAINRHSKHVPYLICLVNINKMDERFIFKGLNCVNKFYWWMKNRADQYINECNIKKRNGVKKDKEQKRWINMWSFNGHKFDLLFFIEKLISRCRVNMIGGITDVKQLNFANLRFFDFYKIFPVGSLASQAEAWKVEIQKGQFNHEKMNRKNIWTHMNEAIDYCIDDCRALGGLVLKFKDFCINVLKISPYQNSCSSMSLNYFRTHYLGLTRILGVDYKFYSILKESYFGGVTICFKHKSDDPKPNTLKRTFEQMEMFKEVETLDEFNEFMNEDYELDRPTKKLKKDENNDSKSAGEFIEITDKKDSEDEEGYNNKYNRVIIEDETEERGFYQRDEHSLSGMEEEQISFEEKKISKTQKNKIKPNHKMFYSYEVIKKVLKNRGGRAKCLYYYDINSSYPFSMLGEIPVELEDSYVFLADINSLNTGLKNLCPYNLYNVESFKFRDEILYPCFQERDGEGQLFYKQASNNRCARWGLEILFALPYLEKIEITHTWVFKLDRFNTRPFKKFIEDMYVRRQEAKKEGNAVMDTCCKLMMNSSYGKFGQKIFPNKEFVNYETLQYKINTNYGTNLDPQKKIITDITPISNNAFMVTNHDINYGSSDKIHISSYIAACSRVALWKIIYKLTENGTKLNVLYCDTDSVITEVKLPDEDLDDLVLGKLKLENIIPNGKEWLDACKKYYDERYEMAKEARLKKESFDKATKIYEEAQAKDEHEFYKEMMGDRYDEVEEACNIDDCETFNPRNEEELKNIETLLDVASTEEKYEDKWKWFAEEGFIANGAKFYYMLALMKKKRDKIPSDELIDIDHPLYNFVKEYYPDFDPEDESKGYCLEYVIKIKGISKKILYKNKETTYKLFKDYLNGSNISFNQKQFLKHQNIPGLIYYINMIKTLQNNTRKRHRIEGCYETIPFTGIEPLS